MYPDELLRAANPVDERDLIDAPDSRIAQALFRNITGIPYHPVQKAVRRRRLNIYALSLVGVLAAGAGVSYAVATHRATRQSVVSCYAEPRLDAHAVEMTGSAADPVAACRGAWAAGHVPGQPAVAGQALTACVLPSGLAGVFPDADGTVCRRLMLTPIDTPLPPATTTTGAAGGTDSQTPVTGMISAVAGRLAGGCLTADQAELAVRGILDQAGLTTWKVTLATAFTPERPCASPGFDELDRRVLIIPRSRQ